MASKHSHHRNPIERVKHIRLQSIAVGPDDEVDIRNSSQLGHSKESPPTSNTNKSEQLSDDVTMAKLSSSTIGDRVSWYDDLKTLVLLALPNSATFLINSLVGVTSVMFIGRIGAEYMGAAAIGTMLANLFGFSIGMGAASALDALCSQAYGAKQYQLVGRHTQRAMVVLTMACFPVAMIWMNAATILGWMGIEEVICKLAGQYVFILIIGMWPRLEKNTNRGIRTTESIHSSLTQCLSCTYFSSLPLVSCLSVFVVIFNVRAFFGRLSFRRCRLLSPPLSSIMFSSSYWIWVSLVRPLPRLYQIGAYS